MRKNNGKAANDYLTQTGAKNNLQKERINGKIEMKILYILKVIINERV